LPSANIIQIKDALKAFQRSLVSEKAHTRGWTFTDGEDHIQQQFKALLFGSAGLAGDKKVIEAAFSMFKDFCKGNKKAIHPNIRGSVYGIVLQEGGKTEVSPSPNQPIPPCPSRVPPHYPPMLNHHSTTPS